MTAAKPVAVVTAGGGGIGGACARDLAGAGWEVVLMSRGDSAQAVARDIAALAIRGDVRDPGDLDRLVSGALERYGRIDGVVVNTGHPPRGALLELADGAWHEGLDLLLLPVARLARLVVPTMVTQGGGAFVVISTLAAVEPDARFPVSSVVRAGVGAYVKLFADAHAAAGIRMNAVLPGFVDHYPVDPDTVAAIPLGRPVTGLEVARTVRFLLSADAGGITGQQVRVDGGLGRSL